MIPFSAVFAVAGIFLEIAQTPQKNNGLLH